jgi:hypothetical protein
MLARFQTVLLLIAVLATPPDLVTRVSAKAQDQCHGICPASRSAQSVAEQHSTKASQHSAAECPNGLAGHYAICLVKSKHKIVYEIVAPLRPAVLSVPATFPVPQLSVQASLPRNDLLLPGFLPLPFQPPRS